MRSISSFILKQLGWKVIQHYKFDLDKLIYAVVPHTSNWDFFLGILLRSKIGFKANFIGKHTLFIWPLGPIMSALGGIPVNRKSSNNFVDQIVAQYKTRKKLAIGIAPEGKRAKVSKLKTGFYFIAKEAQIPIILVKFDYDNKQAVFEKPFYPTDDSDKDLAYINSYFQNVLGKIPENSFGYSQ